MKIERVKNTARNMAYGSALQVFRLLIPFAMRSVMLYLLGVQYLGLNSLFTSVLSVLNLAELGVGAAMVYSMYQPIAEDDAEKICALMRLYRIYYRVIGLVVAVIGLLLLPFIPQLIKGETPPDINVYYLYLLNLAATVLSYWMFAYKSSILQAHQRNDIISKVTLATDGVKYLLQLLVLAAFRNYYAYVLVILLSQAVNNLITALMAERMYPDYRASGQLAREERKQINRRIRDLFTAKVGTVVVYSSDTIVISAFLGLTTLAIYQNYYYLFTAVSSMITLIFASVRAGLGNSIIVDSREKLFRDFKKLLFITAWIAAFCSTCFLCLYQPFMEVWVGKKLLLEFGVVICLVIYFYVHCMNVFLNSYKDASGMWHEDRFRPLVEAGANLAMNIVLVQKIGLYGIVISTILSMLLVAPWLIRNLFRLLFGMEQLLPFLRRMCRYVAAAGTSMTACYLVCRLIHVPPLAAVAVRLMICLAGSNVLLFLFFRRLPEFRQSLTLLERVSGGRLRFERFRTETEI